LNHPFTSRRSFLKGAASLAVAGSSNLRAQGKDTAPWRTFEIITRVELVKPSGATRVWVPGAVLGETPYQRTLANTFECEGGSAKKVQQKDDSLEFIAAEFPQDAKPVLTVTSRIMTRNWMVDFNARPAAERTGDLNHWLRPTKLIPTDGIVKQKAAQITAGAKTDLDKARAIYEWIIENTYRDAKVRGCGVGNIRFMLESGDLGGKCADLNALFVGLSRAAGLPARDVYGIRVAASQLGYKSLGASSDHITKAQHCRAEVHLKEYGWVPADPADVRKVMLEEPPGNRTVNDDMVKQARARLFGSWEMNWIAYNFAHDVALPGSSGAPVGFLMYPQAETADGRIDCLDPDNFKYEILAREIV
jgi:transglutaminase-like putative cysteine protease